MPSTKLIDMGKNGKKRRYTPSSSSFKVSLKADIKLNSQEASQC